MRYCARLQTNPTTVAYRRLAPVVLRETAAIALTQFARSLAGEHDEDEFRSLYQQVGRDRRAQGFALHEVMSSMMLFRGYIFDIARREGVWERPIDAYRVLELDRRFVAFWDKALYQMARGYSSGDLQSRTMAVHEIGRQATGVLLTSVFASSMALLNLFLLLHYSPRLSVVAVAVAASVAAFVVAARAHEERIAPEAAQVPRHVEGRTAEDFGAVVEDVVVLGPLVDPVPAEVGRPHEPPGAGRPPVELELYPSP